MAGDQELELRFDVPLYTLAEASRYLVVPRATLATWADGYERRPANAPAVQGNRSSRLFPTRPAVTLGSHSSESPRRMC